jgi:hypothetical protein
MELIEELKYRFTLPFVSSDVNFVMEKTSKRKEQKSMELIEELKYRFTLPFASSDVNFVVDVEKKEYTTESKDM